MAQNPTFGTHLLPSFSPAFARPYPSNEIWVLPPRFGYVFSDWYPFFLTIFGKARVFQAELDFLQGFYDFMSFWVPWYCYIIIYYTCFVDRTCVSAHVGPRCFPDCGLRLNHHRAGDLAKRALEACFEPRRWPVNMPPAATLAALDHHSLEAAISLRVMRSAIPEAARGCLNASQACSLHGLDLELLRCGLLSNVSLDTGTDRFNWRPGKNCIRH